MMTTSVLDILIYVFDRYMLDDAPDVPEREDLARDLERAGFGPASVERALDWLADLAGERAHPAIAGSGSGSSSWCCRASPGRSRPSRAWRTWCSIAPTRRIDAAACSVRAHTAFWTRGSTAVFRFRDPWPLTI